MNDFLDIFGDVLRLVTFQPASRQAREEPRRNVWTGTGADRSRRHTNHRL